MSGSMMRVVGVGGAVGMGLGSILGTGVFVSLGIGAGVVGPAVVVAVGLAALLATANGLSSAQLAAAHPVSGGTYEYGYRFLHPAAGYAAGWMFLAAKSASAATAALGCAGYALHLAGVEGRGPRVMGALLVVGALTALVAGGLRRSNVVNLLIVGFTIGVLTAFVTLGLLTAPDALPSLASELVTVATDPVALAKATGLMFVAYTGYGRIATLGEEVRDPARTIPRAIIATLVVSMVLYVSVSATAVGVVGAEAFAAATAGVAAPLEVVARSFVVPQFALVVALGAVTAMAGVLLNLLLGLSRVLLAMARRRDMPALFDRIDARTGSPTAAVWAMGAVVAGLVLLGDVRTTWTFSAFTVLVYYGFTNLAALWLPVEHRRFPRWISGGGLVGCLGLAAFVDLPALIAGLAVLAVGFGLRGLRAAA